MPATIQIIGSYLSPYVRKVLAFLHCKDLAYEIDPIVPFFGDDEFAALSPLRRIPVLRDDRVTLCDSSVICQYLEDRYPEPVLFPTDIADRARARWLEEFADTRMGDVFIWRLFNQLAIKPGVWGKAGDGALVEQTLATEVPGVLDYLETQVPPDGFIFGTLSIADLSLATFFRNAALVRCTVDVERWPRTAAFVERVLALDVFARLRPIEDRLIRTPIAQHRAVLESLHAPLTRTSYATSSPRPGVMPI